MKFRRITRDLLAEGVPGEASPLPRPPPIIHSDPAIQGGVPVFFGTRVPVKSLFDYLTAGQSLDRFLGDFASVSKGQAVAALELAREALGVDARPGFGSAS